MFFLCGFQGLMGIFANLDIVIDYVQICEKSPKFLVSFMAPEVLKILNKYYSVDDEKKLTFEHTRHELKSCSACPKDQPKQL